MKIPIKISPDRIKDAFVEVKYTSKVPFEVAVGMFYKSLDETYTYTNRSIGKQQLPSAFPLNLSERLEIQIGSRPLFYNDKIKIELSILLYKMIRITTLVIIKFTFCLENSKLTILCMKKFIIT
jgi:hypothetical protein